MAGETKLFKYCESLPGKTLDYVVIDECAQATEPLCWIALQYAKKAVFAGDHKQLEPTIKSIEASNKGLSNTLFEQTITKYPDVSKMLTIQYRMNEGIMKWSSECMYNGELIAAEEVKHHLLIDNKECKIPEATTGEDLDHFKALLSHCLYLIDTSYCKMYESVEADTSSKYNIGEASLVRVVLEDLKRLGISDDDIGVVTPYNAQATLIRRTLRSPELGRPKIKCEVSTVDGFQGREKEVIIISMVRSNVHGEVGFLRNERRMNVAVTRARKLCVLIGDVECVSKSVVNADKKKTVDNDVKVPEGISTFYNNKISFLANLCEYFMQFGLYKSANEFRNDDRVIFDIGDESPDLEDKKANAKGEESKSKNSKKNKKKKNKGLLYQNKKNLEEKKAEVRPTQKVVQQSTKIEEIVATPILGQLKLDAELEEERKQKELQKKAKEEQQKLEEQKRKEKKERKKKVKEEKAAQAAEQAAEQAKTTDIEETKIQPKIEQTPKRPQTEQSNKKPNKKLTKKEQKAENDKKEKEKLSKMNDDELLDFLIDMNHKCGYIKDGKQCPKQNHMYLRVCLMCSRKYCFPHLQPEVHDCTGLK